MSISRRTLTATAVVVVAAVAGAAAMMAGAQTTTPAGSESQVIRQVAVGTQPGPVTYSYGAGWVVNQGDPSVTRIDAVAGATVTTLIGAGPISITAGYNSIWVLTGQGKSKSTVYRLNPAKGVVQKTFALALPINFALTADIAPSSGYIWVGSDGQPKLVRIDPIQEPGGGQEGAGPRRVTTGNSKLWTTV